MAYKKSELTRFAKICADGAHCTLNGVCLAEEAKGEIQRSILNGNDELLLEVAKRFAKVAKDEIAFNVESGEVQDFQNLIERIIECCDENDWFMENS